MKRGGLTFLDKEDEEEERKGRTREKEGEEEKFMIHEDLCNIQMSVSLNKVLLKHNHVS